MHYGLLSVRFTHISGHPTTTGRAQDRDSSTANDRRSTIDKNPRTKNFADQITPLKMKAPRITSLDNGEIACVYVDLIHRD